MTTPSLTSDLTPPDILRCAYLELVVTDLAASREFYVDILGLTVTYEAEAEEVSSEDVVRRIFEYLPVP